MKEKENSHMKLTALSKQYNVEHGYVVPEISPEAMMRRLHAFRQTKRAIKIRTTRRTSRNKK